METITCASAQMSISPDWRKNFLDLCEDICGVREEDPGSAREPLANAACPYCGQALEIQKPTSSRQKERMCRNCLRRVVRDTNQLQRLVRNTEKNVANLFGIQLKDSLPAKRLLQRREIRKMGKNASSDTSGKSASSDTPAISGFGIIKNKKGQPEACLWESLPDAVIAAEVVRYICESYFKAAYPDWGGTAGAAQWMKVRYLRILDLGKYADTAEKLLCEKDAGEYGYAFWNRHMSDVLKGRTPHISWIAGIIAAEKENANAKTAPVSDDLEQLAPELPAGNTEEQTKSANPPGDPEPPAEQGI